MENIIILVLCIILSIALTTAIYNYYILPKALKDLEPSDITNDDIAKLKRELHHLREENKIMNDEIEKSNLIKYKKFADKFDKLVEKAPMFSYAVDQKSTTRLDEFLKECIFIKDDNKRIYKEYSNSIIACCDAYNLAQKLGIYLEIKLSPLMNKELPRTDKEKRDALETLLDASMICYDSFTTAFGNRNAREKQKINVNLLYNSVNREEALSEAEVMTDRSDLTPLWIRIIKKSVESYGIKESSIIFTGYKLR